MLGSYTPVLPQLASRQSVAFVWLKFRRVCSLNIQTLCRNDAKKLVTPGKVAPRNRGYLCEVECEVTLAAPYRPTPMSNRPQALLTYSVPLWPKGCINQRQVSNRLSVQPPKLLTQPFSNLAYLHPMKPLAKNTLSPVTVTDVDNVLFSRSVWRTGKVAQRAMLLIVLQMFKKYTGWVSPVSPVCHRLFLHKRVQQKSMYNQRYKKDIIYSVTSVSSKYIVYIYFSYFFFLNTRSTYYEPHKVRFISPHIALVFRPETGTTGTVGVKCLIGQGKPCHQLAETTGDRLVTLVTPPIFSSNSALKRHRRTQ